MMANDQALQGPTVHLAPGRGGPNHCSLSTPRLHTKQADGQLEAQILGKGSLGN